MTSEGSNTTAISLRTPVKDDGYRLHQLVAECPPLDPNSIYCNLLQCSHFAETGVAAEIDGDLVGFISGYIPPNSPKPYLSGRWPFTRKVVGRVWPSGC